MRFIREAIKRIPAVAFGVCVAIITTGIALAVILVAFGGSSLHVAQLAMFMVALMLIVCLRIVEKINLGLPITRHELRLVAIAAVVSTWLIALLAILASSRHLNLELYWPVHLAIQMLLVLVVPFVVRSLTGWYSKTFWTGKVSNALKSAGIELIGDSDLEAAARNYALPETLAWAISGAWALATTISNLDQTTGWDDGTVYSVTVTTMTTFSLAYYYSHPDQQRVRNLIKRNSKGTQSPTHQPSDL